MLPKGPTGFKEQFGDKCSEAQAKRTNWKTLVGPFALDLTHDHFPQPPIYCHASSLLPSSPGLPSNPVEAIPPSVGFHILSGNLRNTSGVVTHMFRKLAMTFQLVSF